MPEKKQLVCLATSRKPGGRCIAGRELRLNGYGPWIRPVSNRPGGAISSTECRFASGREPVLRNVLEIPFLDATPQHHQTENHQIDPTSYWKQRGSASWAEMPELVESTPTLWVNGFSTRHGLHDRIPHHQAHSQPNSLFLIQPSEVCLHVFVSSESLGEVKRSVRVSFLYRDVQYNLKVTDTIVERPYLAGDDGNYSIEQPAYLCVSLAEAHTDGFCYKLAASILSEMPLRGIRCNP